MIRPLLVAVSLLLLLSVGSPAATSSSADDLTVPGAGGEAPPLRALDEPTIWADPPPAPTQVVTAPPAAPDAPPPVLSDNPLWAVPLARLSVTRDRPIFTPSRRPPAPAVAPVAVQRVAPPPKPKEPERPQLSLVGTIVSVDEGFGIFLDGLSKVALRLKVGEAYQGWKLRSVRGREVVLEKDDAAATLAMPKPGEERPSSGLEPANSSQRSAVQSARRSDR
jgi:general secretion pathway protein N